ncbi:MAG: 30S ribosomal protein S15 [Nanoarchaeota archaeon]|nr:30S ribosomal protein S15 [Nanoarchaeota archaeon]
MARMHSRDRGKSGSTKPVKKQVPTWVRYKPKEVELLIVKLSKEGNTPSQVGMVLRDTYGIPDIKSLMKKKISRVLDEKKLLKDIPEDLMALMKKAIAVRKHLDENKQDKSAKHGMQLTDSKINRLAKYYKKTGKLPADWKYNPKRLRLYIE